MASLAPLTTASPALLAQASAAQPSAAELAKRSSIDKASKDFEASFLSVMFGQMFEGVSQSEPFGGGPGEDAFKSLLTDAMAKQVVKSGGVGIAASVQKEMLKLQGLS